MVQGLPLAATKSAPEGRRVGHGEAYAAMWGPYWYCAVHAGALHNLPGRQTWMDVRKCAGCDGPRMYRYAATVIWPRVKCRAVSGVDNALELAVSVPATEQTGPLQYGRCV